MKLPRWLHQLYAKAFGYFWYPCPICGNYFGGHEVTNANGCLVYRRTKYTSTGNIVCQRRSCVIEAEERSKQVEVSA